ncbi:sensor histidine kinase [Parabacteroides sp. AF48-14]|uniref:sensor histidine kinase n=1 Tax=Parabacteroides sp. AF48-14 TaxID=2292052 RepID=UPI000EFFEE65|nr:HAMP domain-containing sensor histidine kinase [Parabacteroides sp. AF48-14]RHO74193.1 sensor histidine kinase [Parabacteroides sp. AF48-14]
MEKRIKLIYILSLLSALVAIGVQGYWLYNQYYYEAERYADEVAADVLRVGDEEFAGRKKVALGDDTSFILGRNSQTKSKQDTVSRNVLTQLSLNFDRKGMPDTANEDQVNITKLRISFDPYLPEDSIIHGVERSVVNHHIPFRTERLDSLLRERLPQYDFRVSFLPEGDTLSRFASWEILPGHLFPPCLGVKYRYAPLERKGVMIEVGFTANSLLKKMAWQLVFSLFLIVLLLGCLAFLIKTILTQKKLGELRESFVHTMIHELRRPVQTIKMCIAFLNDKQMRTDEAASDEAVQDAMFELDNLSAYLGKLKNMVSADGSATLLHPVAFNLQELVEKVIRLIHIPSGKQVTFSTAFPPELPPVTADPVHIANILSNLIENAIKYSGPEVNIRVVIIRNEQSVVLTVADNGVGIAPDEQRKVFDKFYRSARLPDKQIPGLGLGLSYVRQVVEAHHGHVSLRSEVGKGTEVTVEIPNIR